MCGLSVIVTMKEMTCWQAGSCGNVNIFLAEACLCVVVTARKN